MPDPAFIVDRRDSLEGLVLTHAPEDHIGAVPYLWPLLKCPIYATPFAAHIARRKLGEAGLSNEAEVIEVPLSGRFAGGLTVVAPEVTGDDRAGGDPDPRQ